MLDGISIIDAWCKSLVSYNDTALDCFHEVKQLLREEKPLGFWETVLSKHRHAAKQRNPPPPSCKVWCKTANNISVLPAPVTAHTKRFSLAFAVSQSSTEIACCPFVNCPDHSKKTVLGLLGLSGKWQNF